MCVLCFFRLFSEFWVFSYRAVPENTETSGKYRKTLLNLRQNKQTHIVEDEAKRLRKAKGHRPL